MQAFLIKAPSFDLCEMLSVFKARINPHSNRPGNLKGGAGFLETSSIIPRQMSERKSKSYTFNFDPLSNTNVKVLTICLGLLCL